MAMPRQNSTDMTVCMCVRARVCSCARVCSYVRIHVLLEQRGRSIAVSKGQGKLVNHLTSERAGISAECGQVAAESCPHQEQLAAARAEVSRLLCFPLSAVMNSSQLLRHGVCREILRCCFSC